MTALRTSKWYIIFLNIILAFVIILSTEARAETYGFKCITNNDPTGVDAAIGEAQLFVDVDEGPLTNQVLFTFSNIGPDASSIEGIYFDDGTLFGIASAGIDNTDPGVSFSQGASPPDLPGGGTMVYPFQASVAFSVDSDPPAQPNGVNPTETLGILFDLKGGQVFDDVIAAINLGFTQPWNDDSLRIGIHVQGFDGDGSESFILTPAPGALILGMLGFGAAGLKLRKFV